MPAMQLADTSKLTGKAQELLGQFEKNVGLVPNILKQMANSPAALEAFLVSRDILSNGLLSAKLRTLIGITIAESYSNEYMLSARIALAKKAGLTDEEIKLAKEQKSQDPKMDAGLQFVRNMVLRHAELPEGDVAELKAAGYSDGEIVELIVNAGQDMMVYYFIQLASPEPDFPRVATAFPV
jgi:alkylhydroperoxidase family enzyme